MMPIMIDGKVCKASMHIKSSLHCYISVSISKDFHDLTKTRGANLEVLQFALSCTSGSVYLKVCCI